MKALLKFVLLLLPVAAMAQSYPPVVVRGPAGSSGTFPFIFSPSFIIPSDADYLMVYPDMSGDGGILVVTSSVALTSPRNVTVPTTGNFNWFVENKTTGGQTVTFKTPSGTGVPILNGYTQAVVCDTVNCSTLPSGSGGTVLSVTGTSPVSCTGGANVTCAMAAATDSVPGYLTAADHTAFNGKQAALGYTPAHSGANSDITSLTGLTTPVPSTAGGSGTNGGTGYRYGNGASPDTYSPTILPSSGALTLGGALNVDNVVLGTGAGTSPTLNYINGYDASFAISFTTGSAPVANEPIFTVTFTANRGHYSFAQISPIYYQYSSLAQIPTFDSTASPTHVIILSGTTALTASTTYILNVMCP
jgi:hypothetical protein